MRYVKHTIETMNNRGRIREYLCMFLSNNLCDSRNTPISQTIKSGSHVSMAFNIARVRLRMHSAVRDMHNSSSCSTWSRST